MPIRFWTLLLPAAAFLASRPAAARAQAEAAPEATSLLGRPLYAPRLSDQTRQTYQARWDAAKRAFDRTPNNADSIIWLGRRTAYLGRFREAIAIYGAGIAKFPNDARLYRHRGHRYLTVRELDRAIADLERAALLAKGTPDQIEPDGIPNRANRPTSTLQSNIRYHLALAYYLKGDFTRAASGFEDDVKRRVNDDMLVASTHWLYMALRRAGRDSAAAQALERVGPKVQVIENEAYLRLIRLYQSKLPVDSLWPRSAEADQGPTVEDVARLYGIGNYFWYNGRRDIGARAFDRIVATDQWPAFGYLAAEAEVARWDRPH